LAAAKASAATPAASTLRVQSLTRLPSGRISRRGIVTEGGLETSDRGASADRTQRVTMASLGSAWVPSSATGSFVSGSYVSEGWGGTPRAASVGATIVAPSSSGSGGSAATEAADNGSRSCQPMPRDGAILHERAIPGGKGLLRRHLDRRERELQLMQWRLEKLHKECETLQQRKGGSRVSGPSCTDDGT